MIEKHFSSAKDHLTPYQHEKPGLHGPIALPLSDADANHGASRRITRFLTLRNLVSIILTMLTTILGLLLLHHHRRPCEEPAPTPQAYYVRGFSDALCQNPVWTLTGQEPTTCEAFPNPGPLPATHVRYNIGPEETVYLYNNAGCHGASQDLVGNSPPGGCVALAGPVSHYMEI